MIIATFLYRLAFLFTPKNGPNQVVVSNGHIIQKCWLNEQELFHRKDGPAVESINGSKSWYLNGELHREDGPAVEYSSGSKHWYLNGKPATEEEVKRYKLVKELAGVK